MVRFSWRLQQTRPEDLTPHHQGSGEPWKVLEQKSDLSKEILAFVKHLVSQQHQEKGSVVQHKCPGQKRGTKWP